MMKRSVWFFLLTFLGCAMLWLVYTIDPHQSTLFPRCPFKIFTGWNCPGCGSTRAVHLLLHGRVSDALDRNFLMVVSIPILITMIIRPAITRLPWVPWLFFGILILYGVARNAPIYPFHYLAP
jgi:hypothetical protein